VPVDEVRLRWYPFFGVMVTTLGAPLNSLNSRLDGDPNLGERERLGSPLLLRRCFDWVWNTVGDFARAGCLVESGEMGWFLSTMAGLREAVGGVGLKAESRAGVAVEPGEEPRRP